MKRITTVLACVMVTWVAAAESVKVIFDTDMLTDFDDVGALACLHALADAGECEGWIEPAAEDALSDASRYVPVKSAGDACIRFFYEGRHGSDWNDAGYDFGSSGYGQLSECNSAFVQSGRKPTVWPAVGIGGKRPMSVPELVRGVRRAAECEETLSFHVPGCSPDDVAKDAELADAVDAMRREAERLNVRVEP